MGLLNQSILARSHGDTVKIGWCATIWRLITSALAGDAATTSTEHHHRPACCLADSRWILNTVTWHLLSRPRADTTPALHLTVCRTTCLQRYIATFCRNWMHLFRRSVLSFNLWFDYFHYICILPKDYRNCYCYLFMLYALQQMWIRNEIQDVSAVGTG